MSSPVAGFESCLVTLRLSCLSHASGMELKPATCHAIMNSSAIVDGHAVSFRTCVMELQFISIDDSVLLRFAICADSKPLVKYSCLCLNRICGEFQMHSAFPNQIYKHIMFGLRFG
jgi:hypothetical protein